MYITQINLDFLNDDFCSTCKFFCIKSEALIPFNYDKVVSFFKENPIVSQDTINFYKNQNIELQDIQPDNKATPYTVYRLILDISNIMNPIGNYKFGCTTNSLHCQYRGYSCFYRN